MQNQLNGRLQGKVAIIVGAGQLAGDTVGNGRAVAERFEWLASHGTAAQLRLRWHPRAVRAATLREAEMANLPLISVIPAKAGSWLCY